MLNITTSIAALLMLAIVELPAQQTTTAASGTATTSARGGDARGGDVKGGDVKGGNVQGGSVVGGTVTGGSVTGGTAQGGTVSSGSVSAGTVTSGTVGAGSASASVNGRQITARAPGGVSIQTNDSNAVVTIGGKSIVVEKERLLLDGQEKAKLPSTVTNIAIDAEGTRLIVKADGKEILSTESKDAR
jgi:hypothetical protein